MADNQNVIVTKAGIEALINAEKTGTEKLTLDSVKLTSAPFDATYNTESISDDAVCATLTAVGGEQTGDQTISVTATDNSDAAYSAYGFGIYAGDVLFAVYSASSPIINKVAGSAAMLAADIFVSNGSVASIAFGDVSFQMPAATSTKEGAIRIATDAEALAKTDSTIALCPSNLKTLNFAVATDVSDTYATKASLIARLPAGVIIPFAGTSVPSGYLLCNGALVSRTTYADLFAAVGTLYGAGDGSTTFALPDYRDRVLQGASASHAAGTYIAAGLPNITGYAGRTFLAGNSTEQEAFYFLNKSDYTWQRVAPDSANKITADARLDASRLSTVFGASSTVQPLAAAIQYLIKY